MTTIDSMSNWYRSSRIEYFTPFMKLWLAFNGWYKMNYNTTTDKGALDKMKVDKIFQDRLLTLFFSDSDQALEFNRYLGELVREIRNGGLIGKNGDVFDFSQTDTYNGCTAKDVGKKIEAGEQIVRLTEEIVIKSDTNTVLTELMGVIYQVRNNVIHGDFDLNNKRAKLLVKNSYIVLDILLQPLFGDE